ncbi:toxin YdaT domain-containing protein [Photorhabdus sp. APURE]|uniref:toxin YdaT family protein n=1 Tax=Photorhabdus aballayi TaxID=2991723 RepID=UPI00223E8DA0|nr:toxin YdaT family protein [Photorhabdus aballayi]MCW7549226.1 toxin YdaT domain-containing protein [Photorhabdus aballayi]
MKPNINAIKAEVEAWAAERGQEYVAIEISRMYFLLNDSFSQSRLHLIEDESGNADWKAINNNRQQIFRWLRSDSNAARRKISELLPAIEAALPAERRARLMSADNLNYLASIAIKEFAAAMSETLLGGRDMSHRIAVAISALNAMEPRLTNVH